jgi:hypothetical protein
MQLATCKAELWFLFYWSDCVFPHMVWYYCSCELECLSLVICTVSLNKWSRKCKKRMACRVRSNWVTAILNQVQLLERNCSGSYRISLK